MTDRKPIMCGGTVLKWDGINSYDMAPIGPIEGYVLISECGTYWEWSLRVGEEWCQHGDGATPEAAAEDLARFLGELHEATRGFGKGKDDADICADT